MPVATRPVSWPLDTDQTGGLRHTHSSHGPGTLIHASYGSSAEMARFVGVPCASILAWNRQVAWINEISVTPARRGRGVGTSLMKDFLVTLKGIGVGVVLLLPVPERDSFMPALLRFYDRLGFNPLEDSRPLILYRELDL